MEKLAVNSNTPATDAAFELLTQIAIDLANDERYPRLLTTDRRLRGGIRVIFLAIALTPIV